MGSMFYYATNFESDLSNWDVSNVLDISYMFYCAKKFNSDLSKWNVSKVFWCQGFLHNAVKIDTDLSGWRMANKIIDVDTLIFNCPKMTSEKFPKVYKQ